MRYPRTLTAVVSLALAASCAAPDPARPVQDGVFPVPGLRSTHHRLRFVDGQLSRNDHCIIRLGNQLNAKVPPMYVNGEPVGFC